MSKSSPINILLAISQETDLENLRNMSEAIASRMRVMSEIRGTNVKVGDKIHFSSTISPSYLRGLTATVVGVNRKSVSVSCPNDIAYGRFKGVSKVRLPLSLIQ